MGKLTLVRGTLQGDSSVPAAGPRTVSAAQPGGLACKYRNKSTQALSLASVEWCEHKSASLVVWPSDRPEERKRVPFRCRSWRHAGECQRWKGAQDFVRCRDAVLSRGAEWVYVVLTLLQRSYSEPWEAYRDGYQLWKVLSLRLSRRYGKIEYLQTWEAHQSGFPHVNIALFNHKIWDLCAGEGWRRWRQELKRHLTEIGFGYVVHVEPLREGEGLGLVGYLTKLSRELTGASVKDQVPLNAPRHFRRLRASRGLLPPVHRKQGWTGFLDRNLGAEKGGVADVHDVQRPVGS